MPPEAVIVAEPLLPPLHKMFDAEVAELTALVGCVIVTVLVIVQLLASVTVTVFAPEI